MGYYNNKKILTVMRRSNEILPEVEIKRIWLSYDPDSRFVNYNYLVGTGIWKDEETNELIYRQVINDASKIFINFKTSSITKAIEDEITAGRFVIRFDYPVRFKNNKFRNPLHIGRPTLYANKVKGGKPSGHGSRSFTYNLFELDSSEDETPKKDFFVNSLVFITPEDIKTDDFGEKYILKQLSFLEFMNKMWKPTVGELTLLDDDVQNYILENYFAKFIGGIPQFAIDDMQNIGRLGNNGSSSVPAKLHLTGESRINYPYRFISNSDDAVVNLQHYNSIAKYTFDAMYNMYAPLQCTFPSTMGMSSELVVDSQFLLQRNRHVKLVYHDEVYPFYSVAAPDQSKLHVKFFKTAVKPRCCIIDENYATKPASEGSIWLKKFSLCEQNIFTTYKTMLQYPTHTQEGEDYVFIPVLKIKIDTVKNEK